MAVDVDGGTFRDELFVVEREDGKVGAAMALTFQPAPRFLSGIPGVDHSTLAIDLVQVVRELREPGSREDDDDIQRNAGFRQRQLPSGPHQGWGIDVDWQAAYDVGYRKISTARREQLEREIARLDEAIAGGDGSGKARVEVLRWQLAVDRRKGDSRAGDGAAGKVLTSLDPRYAQQRVAPDVPLYTTAGTGQAGNSVVLDEPYRATGRAGLRDAPSVPLSSAVLGMEFEVAALVEYGQPGARRTRFVGSVKWGWQRPAQRSDVRLAPLALVNRSGVGPAFGAAAAHWNTLTVEDPAGLVRGPQGVMPLPV